MLDINANNLESRKIREVCPANPSSTSSRTGSVPYESDLRESLQKAGLIHVNDLAFGNTRVIGKCIELDASKMRILQTAAIRKVQKYANNYPFTTAYDILQARTTERFSTGSIGLDGILGGGVETGAITQFYGDPGSGKTQICFTSCVLLASLGYKIIYIDTEGKFRVERIEEIAMSRNIDYEKIRKSIIISRPYGTISQEECIEHSYLEIKRNPKIKLLIVDSMTNHYVAEYPGRQFLQTRMNKLNVQIHILLSIARLNNIAVIITNRPHSFVSDDQMGVKDLMPYGGNILSSTSTHIIHVERISRNNEFTAKLVKSPVYPNTSASFAITSSGIEDIANSKKILPMI